MTNRLPSRAVALALLFATAASTAFAQSATTGERAYALNARPAVGSVALDTQPSADFRSVIASLRAKRTGDARTARDRLPAGSFERRVADWAIAAYGRAVPATELATVLNEVPDWPLQTRIRARLEAAILRADPPAEALRVAFSAADPETVTARLALAGAHLEAGDRRSAAALARTVWREETLDAAGERRFLARFGSLMQRADHRARVERLLALDRLTAAGRIAGEAGATRLVAAFAAVVRERGSARALAAVPASQRTDPLYAIAASRYERGRERYRAAAQVLLRAKPASAPRAADALWREHRIVAKQSLAAGRTKIAYRLASRDVAGTSRAKADAAFLAGWMALRHRNDPRTARRHFAALSGIATLPATKARAAYWTGRALEASGDGGGAKRAYAGGARYDTTFYGQLSAARIGRNIEISRARPTPAGRRVLESDPIYAAMRLLENAKAPGYASAFRTLLAYRLDDPAALAQVALEAERRGDHRAALTVGKLAAGRGLAVDTLSHPLGAIPSGHGLSKGELALAYAVSRQESSFQIDARSPADALGLMQLLPGTARQTARSIGAGYSRGRLTTDPAYNVRLGTTFLSRQIDAFGGSLPLALAAYNAGPRRAREWVEELGDPRRMSDDDALDWVESIPFAETRGYVQKVLANRGVYRTRLLGGATDTAKVLNDGKP